MGDHENLMFAAKLAGMRRRRGDSGGDRSGGDRGSRESAIQALTAMQGPIPEDPLVARFMEDHLQGRRQQEGYRQREREGETTYQRERAMRAYDQVLRQQDADTAWSRETPVREAGLEQHRAATEASKAQTELARRGLTDDTRTAAEREAAAEASALKRIKAEATAREYPEPPESAKGGAGGPRPMRRDEQMAYAQSVLETMAKLQAAGTIDDAEAKALAPRIMRGEQAAIERVLKAPDLEQQQVTQDQRRTLMDDAAKELDKSTPGVVASLLGGEGEEWQEPGRITQGGYWSESPEAAVERARKLQKANPKFAKHGITAEEMAEHYRKRVD